MNWLFTLEADVSLPGWVMTPGLGPTEEGAGPMIAYCINPERGATLRIEGPEAEVVLTPEWQCCGWVIYVTCVWWWRLCDLLPGRHRVRSEWVSDKEHHVPSQS